MKINMAYVVSKRGSRAYIPVSVHPSLKAAKAHIESVGGRIASFAKYPNERTYVIDIVENRS